MVTAADTDPRSESAAAPVVRWEEICCPLCQRDNYETICQAVDGDPEVGGLSFAVVRCQNCDLYFTNPRPDEASILPFYSRSYPAFRKPKLFPRMIRRWYPFARIKGWPCQERRTLPWHGQGRLLDFGCGGGSFLLRMHDQGWKVIGLDRNEHVILHLRKLLGHKAIVGSLPHHDLAERSQDVITMWSTLAHVHQPLTIMQEAYRLLVPGGRIYIEVPNIASWGFHWFASYWHGLDLPRHLIHFSPVTLKTLLEKAQFRILSLKTLAYPSWMRASARSTFHIAGYPFVTQLLRLNPIAKFIAWLGYLSGKADTILCCAERPDC